MNLLNITYLKISNDLYVFTFIITDMYLIKI